jgi:hypothetical protein
MNRRLIVLLCILWGIGCCAFVCVYAAVPNESKGDTLPQYEISFTMPELSAVSLPHRLPGTDLLIRDIYSHESTTAILVKNIGPYGIESARIVVCQGSRLLKFTAVKILPGADVIVLEEQGTEYYHEPIGYCYGSQRICLDLN